MLGKESVVFWNEIEKDLYEENGYIFGIELDLFNNHKSYYCKISEKTSPHSDSQRVCYYQLSDDIYKAIDQFNEMIAAAR
jgi:hypothetical protein